MPTARSMNEKEINESARYRAKRLVEMYSREEAIDIARSRAFEYERGTTSAKVWEKVHFYLINNK